MNLYGQFISKPREVMARELITNEVVNCYNGVRIGNKGDFVVVDSEDRVMIIRRDRFRRDFMEVTSEQQVC